MDRLRVALMIDRRVPVELYGGTERAVVWLAQELTRQGHAVTLITSPGSFVPGARMIFAKSGDEAFARVPDDVDIVNSFSWRPPAGFKRPCLSTTQGNGTPPRGGNWSFVSRDHARRHGRETFVYNGLPADEHYFSDEKSDRFLFFSRINRAGKNVTRALNLAKTNDLELDLAGGGRWELLTRSQVRKDGAFFLGLDRRFHFYGMVGGWKKAKLFADAKALLFPIRWEEPFGIVVVEALLAGTTVIACPRGSMPELIRPDIGFLCDTDDEFAAAFENVASIPPHRCREYAAEHFSITKTTGQYVELYRRILDGETLP
jgi:glycosyltransferase involved in cell wall biosynthesis